MMAIRGSRSRVEALREIGSHAGELGAMLLALPSLKIFHGFEAVKSSPYEGILQSGFPYAR